MGAVGNVPRVGTDPAFAVARAAGIKVLSWDSDIAVSRRAVFINPTNTEGLGEKLLESLQQMLGPAGGDFAILSSMPTAVNRTLGSPSMKQRLATDPSLQNVSLLTVVYGQESADVSADQVKALVQDYPTLKGIIVPDGIGLEAAAQALSGIGLLGEVKLTGLGPMSQLRSYIKAGAVQNIWWNVPSLGTLSYYAAQALATGKITGAPGETFEAGEQGTFTIGDKER